MKKFIIKNLAFLVILFAMESTLFAVHAYSSTSITMWEVQMDKKFTFRYYDLTRDDGRSPRFADILDDIIKIPEAADREKQLAANFIVRLERLEKDGADAVVGEMVRCQGTNLPSEIVDGTRQIIDADQLGHSVVFRYNFRLGKLGIQYDVRTLSPGRLLEYVSAFHAAAIYSLQPIVNADAWRKFMAGDVRRLTARIANPSDMGELDGVHNAAGQGFKAMAEAYNAPMITLEISMGTFPGALSKATNALAQGLAAMNFPGVSLDKLRGKVVTNDQIEEFDLIEDRVVTKADLEIHDKDHNVNWNIKRKFLSDDMKRLFA